MLKRLLSTEADDHIGSLEKTMQDVVQAWENNTLKDESEHIHSIYAPPGGGKSWLLDRWKARWDGILLDLATESRSQTAYIQNMKAKLQNAPPKHILYLDNIPGTEDELTRAFQEEILEPELCARNLVIQACAHFRQTGWGGKIPHITPLPIPALSLEGANTVRRKFGILSPLNETENILFSKGVLPGLVKAWCEGLKQKQDPSDILRDYLAAWWQRSGEAMPENFSNHLLPLAALACRDDFSAKTAFSPQQNKVLLENGIQFSENGMPFQLKMKRLGWMQPNSAWYSPIGTVLQAWLFLRKPHVYSCLTEN